MLAKSCAMNKKKNGSLNYLSLRNTTNFTSNFNDFFGSFNISEKDHEVWYGEAKIANEMKEEDLEPHFHTGL